MTYSRRCIAAAGAFALAAAVLFAAAAGEAAASPRMRAAACGPNVVYAGSYNNTVQIFDQSKLRAGPCGSIAGLKNVQGLFVDGQRNLWVANAGTQQVFAFAPGSSTPSVTLADPPGSPAAVAVDGRTGTVYVANSQNKGSAPGTIEVYAGGSTSPTSSLADPNVAFIFTVALDDQSDVYVAFLPPGSFGTGHVDEWTGGSGSPTDLGLSIRAPGGLQTTASGALLACDQIVPACGEFVPGSTMMTNSFATREPNPYAIALDRRENRAYVEDPASGKLYAYKYPGPDARPLVSVAVPGGAYSGVAVSPADPPGAPW